MPLSGDGMLYFIPRTKVRKLPSFLINQRQPQTRKKSCTASNKEKASAVTESVKADPHVCMIREISSKLALLPALI